MTLFKLFFPLMKVMHTTCSQKNSQRSLCDKLLMVDKKYNNVSNRSRREPPITTCYENFYMNLLRK